MLTCFSIRNINMKIIRYTQSLKCCLFSSYRSYSHRSFCVKNIYERSNFNCFKSLDKHYPLPVQFSLLSSLMKNSTVETVPKEDESLLSDPFALSFTNRLYRHPGIFHNILVIQPRARSNKEQMEESERKLSEAVALVHTLPHWKVVEKHIISTTSINSKLIYGTGNLEKIKSIVQSNMSISAIFIGVDIMTALQNTSLEKYFDVPVFDRYQIILQIFHNHAHTKEAKLQLALAEIPYLRVKLASYSHTFDDTNFTGINYVGGSGETFMEQRKRLLNEREIKIKKSLEKVKNQREFLRNTERRTILPIVAVVGYTNCGKTTLIKSLTNDSRLLPEDKLFATLDVTLHAGRLPSSQKVLFIDTVGFISNVPTGLIQSFRSTLEEIVLADLVIHVRDISHPHTEKQKDTVLKTLKELDLPQKLLDSIIEVRNKVDLLENKPTGSDSDGLYISATEGTGLPELLDVTEEKLIHNTDRSVLLIRVLSGGEEYRWLMKEGAIRDSIVDTKDQNYIILEVILSAANLAKFKHQYGDLTISLEDVM